MKKTVITFGMVILFSGAILIFCGQNSRLMKLPLSSSPDSLTVCELPEPDSASAYETFKQLTLLRLSDNEKELLRLHAEIGSNSKQQVKAEYFNTLLVLRHRNNALKTRIIEYTECDQHNWIAFERTFLLDMDQLERITIDFRFVREVVI